MRLLMILLVVVSLLAIGSSTVLAAADSNGPAPNSGDGIPDGSGFDGPNGTGVGGAPNSGDGIPDGSGF